jgi:DNA polymerase-3 subunit chi
MPEISFYILPTHSAQERYLFACKLIEKTYRNHYFCYVLTDTSEQSQLIDDLLWTFRPGSFIPHHLYAGENPAYNNTILIGSLNAPENWNKTLVNLSSQCPQDFLQADRILEVLDNNEEIIEAGRLRYRQYQQSGALINTHKMGAQI